MTTITRQRRMTKRRALLLAGLAGTVALLSLGTATAAASPAATGKVTGTCWKDVVNDWIQHQPNVVGTYPLPCYTQAIQHLNDYPDIQQYSSAPDDIHRALLAAIAKQNGGGSGGPSFPTPHSLGGGGATGGPPGGTTNDTTSVGGVTLGGTSSATHTSETAAANRSFVTKLFDSVGPGNAQSVPLPLLVLAGLAILLLLAAAGMWLAKRLQSRRMTPATASARAVTPPGE
jgi:hypothetical protein